MSCNAPYPSYQRMSQVVVAAPMRPQKGPVPPVTNCPFNKVDIGGACYPTRNKCEGNNMSGTGFCSANNVQEYQLPVSDMRNFYPQLLN